MSGPAERAAARRAARRDGAARPGTASSGGPSKGRVASAASAVRDRPTLTGRAVVLAAVLGLLVFTLAVPMRELFRQRAEINALRAENAATALRVDELTQKQERLQDPAYVQSLIRERLHYVLPGEVGYVVLDPAEAPAPSSKPAQVARAPWYATLWQAVRTTDQAGVPAPVRPGIPVRPDAPR
ncbi:MAG: septum formation initiator family protein [Candidatus Nanopelagicales bacterium]|jgi:cell division protein FtsB